MRRNFERMRVDGPQQPPPQHMQQQQQPRQNYGDPYSQVANRAAPAPPDRNASYAYGGYNNTLPPPGQVPVSEINRPYTPSSSKKTVSFDANLATEMGSRRAAEEASYVNYQVNVDPPEPDTPSSPAGMQRAVGEHPVNHLFDSQQRQQPPYQGQPVNRSQQPQAPYYPPSSAGYHPQTSHYQPRPQQSNGPQYTGPPPPMSQNGPSSQVPGPQYPYQAYNQPPMSQAPPFNGSTHPQTPPHSSAQMLLTGDTPGVVGGQEVYRDPRERMLAEKSQGLRPPGSGERMSFRDKMRMFASEAGENTPQDRSKISTAQRRIDAQLH